MTRSTLTHRLEALKPAGLSTFHRGMSHAEFETHLQQMREHLKEQVNAAMSFAGQQGLSPIECAEIALNVAADVVRFMYGASSLPVLAQKVVDRAGMPFGEGQK